MQKIEINLVGENNESKNETNALYFELYGQWERIYFRQQ